MRSSSPFMAKAVTAMTGMALRSSSSFSHFVTSRPETSGSWMSIKMRSLVGAGELERLDAVAGLQGGVAMRLEEVVEELHIELVVLDDENGFLHDGCPAGPKASRARPSPRPHFAG